MSSYATLDAVEALSRKLYQPRAIIQVIRQSMTWTAPADGLLSYDLVGAGGSGAVASKNNGSNTRATGGGSAEWVTDVIPVAAGQTFTFTLGAGGAPATIASNAGVANGNDGGATSVTGPGGYSVTVAAGKKGNAQNANSVLVLGGLGGTGGTGAVKLRVAGVNAPSILATCTTGLSIATSGAAVNVFNLPAGTFASDVDGVTSGIAYQGGMGVCGPGFTSGGGGAGGGSGGPATGNTLALVGPNFSGDPVQASPSGVALDCTPFMLDAFGGGGFNTTAPGPGGGAGAYNSLTPLASGRFAGGPAGASSSTGTLIAQPQTHGAGTGGVTATGGTAHASTSGKGGDAYGVIRFYPKA